jgi:hypothetical protein
MFKLPEIEKNKKVSRKDVLWVRIDGDMKNFIRKEAKDLGVTRASLIRWCVQTVQNNNMTNKLKSK